MKRLFPILAVSFLVFFSVACLGESAKKAEMSLDTAVAEVTGTLSSTEITAAEFMDMYVGGEDFVLIDVRTKEEYDSGHIPGAINIPYTELDQRVDELGLSKDQKIVVYCEAGVRSKKGANALLKSGYTNIVDLSDGMRGWRALDGDIVAPVIEPPQTDKPDETQKPEVSIIPEEPIEQETPVTPTTTTPPATTWPQTTTPSESGYLNAEPVVILEGFEGTKTVDLKMYSTIKIDDGYIYLTDEKDGCLGLYIWEFNIYRDTEKGGLYEGTSSFLNTEIETPQDVSDNIHSVSDALDDYQIKVVDWSEGSQGGADLQITR